MHRHRSANLNGKHYADNFKYTGLDYFRLRLRIRAALKAFGPMTTQRIVRAAGAEFTERAVRIAIKQLEEAGEVLRPIQEQRWRLAR